MVRSQEADAMAGIMLRLPCLLTGQDPIHVQPGAARLIINAQHLGDQRFRHLWDTPQGGVAEHSSRCLQALRPLQRPAQNTALEVVAFDISRMCRTYLALRSKKEILSAAEGWAPHGTESGGENKIT